MIVDSLNREVHDKFVVIVTDNAMFYFVRLCVYWSFLSHIYSLTQNYCGCLCWRYLCSVTFKILMIVMGMIRQYCLIISAAPTTAVSSRCCWKKLISMVTIWPVFHPGCLFGLHSCVAWMRHITNWSICHSPYGHVPRSWNLIFQATVCLHCPAARLSQFSCSLMEMLTCDLALRLPSRLRLRYHLISRLSSLRQTQITAALTYVTWSDGVTGLTSVLWPTLETFPHNPVRLTVANLGSKSWTFHTTSLRKYRLFCRASRHSLNDSIFHTTGWRGLVPLNAILPHCDCLICPTTRYSSWIWQKIVTILHHLWRFPCQYHHPLFSAPDLDFAAVHSRWKGLLCLMCLLMCFFGLLSINCPFAKILYKNLIKNFTLHLSAVCDWQWDPVRFKRVKAVALLNSWRKLLLYYCFQLIWSMLIDFW